MLLHEMEAFTIEALGKRPLFLRLQSNGAVVRQGPTVSGNMEGNVGARIFLQCARLLDDKALARSGLHETRADERLRVDKFTFYNRHGVGTCIEFRGGWTARAALHQYFLRWADEVLELTNAWYYRALCDGVWHEIRFDLSREVLGPLRAKAAAAEKFEIPHGSTLLYDSEFVGPDYYLTPGGDVLVDGRNSSKEPVRPASKSEAIGAIILAARIYSMPQLLEVLPKGPSTAQECPSCEGKRWLKPPSLVEASTWIADSVCAVCDGLGWIDSQKPQSLDSASKPAAGPPSPLSADLTPSPFGRVLPGPYARSRMSPLAQKDAVRFTLNENLLRLLRGKRNGPAGRLDDPVVKAHDAFALFDGFGDGIYLTSRGRVLIDA